VLAAGGGLDEYIAYVRTLADIAAQDWVSVIRDAGSYNALVDAGGPPGYREAKKITNGKVWLAQATAQMGDTAGGEALIAVTPLDCDACVLARGQIATLKHNWVDASHWFQMVSARSPHIPFADTNWGQSLLAQGKSDAAVEKFKLANQKGPKFADPLEGWGEALMAKNQSHLALAKFAEAEKYAPNWGRLHLKWGEALVYAGKKDEAKTQFARAAALDLTAAEKAELARHP
jgi:tetratricopeptide (TPR) repeat protein